MIAKKSVSLVQVNFSQGPSELNAYYLPYSVGVLWAMVQSCPDLQARFRLNEIIWRRDRISEVIEKLQHSHVVLFSTYVWNRNYNYSLAQRLKEINPDIITMFGGPEIPYTRQDLFQVLPFADYVIKNEGELALMKLLKNIHDPDSVASIPGLVINHRGTKIDTGEPERIDRLDHLPSPYLTGVFDELVEKNPGMNWNGTLETNRGCPYQCTFCDWGSLTYSKIRQFPLDRVLAELDWIGRNCAFISVADANFGIFPERDSSIADKMIEIQTMHGLIKGYSMAWMKNTRPGVTDIIKKFVDNPTSRVNPLTVSVQSMDEEVLDVIKRKNLKMHRLIDIFRDCYEKRIPVYTELILGLPKETLTSWKKNFFTIFEAGNHHGIDVLQAQLLENAELNLVQRDMYQIKTARVYDYLSSYDVHDEAPESIEIVTATDTMPHEDMLEAQVWTTFITAFHIRDLSSWIARFVNRHYNIELDQFYQEWYEEIQHDVWFRNEFDTLHGYFERWPKNGYFDNSPEAATTGITIMYRMLVDIHCEPGKIDDVFDIMHAWLRRRFKMPENLLLELIEFQRDAFMTYNTLKLLPYAKTYSHNFLGYVVDGENLHQTSRVEFSTDEDPDVTELRFLENLYFGRKRYYGQTTMNVRAQ